MMSTQMLQTINDMQTNVQSGLPVIPNNGNPAGAYNMPQQATAIGGAITGAPPAPADPWPWLKPSPFMSALAEDLKARSAMLQQQIGQANNYMPQQPTTQPVPEQAPMPQGPRDIRSAMLQVMGQPAPHGAAPIPQAAAPIQAQPVTQYSGSNPVIPQAGSRPNMPAVRMF